MWVKMRPRHSFLAWPLLPQNQTSPRRKGLELTVEAEGRDVLRDPDPPCGRLSTCHRSFGNGCSCSLLHRAATQRACCDELCSVYSRFCGFGLGVSILPPQPTSPAPGNFALSNLKKARQWRAFANWQPVSGHRIWPLPVGNSR
jgi:hypothetical protein